MLIVEPIDYAKEMRLKVPTPQGASSCVVVSGYAFFTSDINTGNALIGSEDGDGKLVKYTVHLVVGPKWVRLEDVSAIVTRGGYYHVDQADGTGYEISSCRFESAGLPEPEQVLERIKLIVKMRVSGGKLHKQLVLAYHLTAVGVLAPGVKF